MRSIPLADCVQQVCGTPTVILAGSGISLASPALLPTAFQVLSEITLPAIMPPGATVNEKAALTQALPELYYQAANEFTQGAANPIWQLLDFGSSHPRLLRHRLGPNLYHLMLTLVAWRSRLPLITTNFDMLFEAAATQLGLKSVVCHKHYSQVSASDAVAIWKVHGSIDNISELHTDLFRISTPAPELAQALARVLQAGQLCIIGYSGRDVDLFPLLLAQPMRHPAYWIDLAFPPDHLLRRLDATKPATIPFVAVLDPARSFATELHAHIKRSGALTASAASAAALLARPGVRADRTSRLRLFFLEGSTGRIDTQLVAEDRAKASLSAIA